MPAGAGMITRPGIWHGGANQRRVTRLMDVTAHLSPALALQADGGVAPEWVMLLPGPVIATADGRGPYRVTDPAQLAAASLQAAGGRLPIDENHATDLAAPQDGPSPARGWIVAIEPRQDDTIWGRVDWSQGGRALFAEHAYRFISPVFTHLEDGRITGILRASLTNRPNLRGMAALHQETNVNLLAQLRQLLGLAADADDAA